MSIESSDDLAGVARQGARSAPAVVYGFPGHVLISINDEPEEVPNVYDRALVLAA